LRDASRPFGRHDAELGQMTAQGIDDLGSLLHQKTPGLKHESCGLSLLALGTSHGDAAPSRRARMNCHSSATRG
jgi:hypothetical protein